VPAPGEAALLAEVVELPARNEQLEQALESRAVIEQERGMVMVLAPCSCEQAWGLLVDVSQHCNVKLRDVAEAWVATALSVISQPRKNQEEEDHGATPPGA
jgi:AmiR/NasT family two-component response regulator